MLFPKWGWLFCQNSCTTTSRLVGVDCQGVLVFGCVIIQW